MSRFTISLSLASLIVGISIPEPTADACGVKLAIKTTRQRARAKQTPVAASDREVVARRAARQPVAVGPAAPRITIKTKAAEGKAEPTPTQPAPVVAKVDQPATSKTLSGTAPAEQKAPAAVMKEPVKSPAAPTVAEVATKDAAKNPTAKDATAKDATAKDATAKDAGKPVAVAKADATTSKAAEPARKKKKRPTVAATTSSKTVEPPKPETPAVLDAEVFYGLGRTIAEDNANLDSAIQWLNANPTVHATIEGYADAKGWPDRNLMISRMRADAAFKYLVDHGIDGTRLEVQAFGDTKLKYDRDDARNRRVAVEAKR